MSRLVGIAGRIILPGSVQPVKIMGLTWSSLSTCLLKKRRGVGNAPKEYRLATQTLKKIRVFELAKTLGLETKAVLDYCRDLGYDVKNQLSSLETDQVDALKQRIAKGGRPSSAASLS